ncbi:MAG: family 1 glycosylhydrolase [Candidatus Niyogibacteria bacterium]|nr:family 1 glycosylhydrolase [Candidatus Niyogibacteria bacterium]
MKFPRNFYWGAASSAYQVEGGIRNNWTPYFDAERATDHYNRFREDFDIAKSLGHNAHRFSIEWSRIEPQEGEWDVHEIEHYRIVIRALRERGMEPFVTLWHWTLPQWLEKKGGWLNTDIANYFSRFCEKMAEEFKGDITFWITENEPMVYASHAYWRGDWPPKCAGIFAYLGAIRNLVKGHRAAFAAIKRTQPEAKIGIAKNMIFFEGSGADAVLARLADWWWNQRFLNLIRDYQDFIGVNYYFHDRIRNFRFNQNENKVVSDIGWEIHPEGIYKVLKSLEKFGKPIYITENGIADAADSKRTAFIQEHLRFVEMAIRDGIDVRGYFYWALTDNFEWDKGFGPRFGLVEIDYETMERRIRPSARSYRVELSP